MRQHGQSGRYITDLMPHLAKQVDELAFVHGDGGVLSAHCSLVLGRA